MARQSSMSNPGQGRPKDPNLPENPLPKDFGAATFLWSRVSGSTIRILWIRVARRSTDWIMSEEKHRALETNPFVAPPRQP